MGNCCGKDELPNVTVKDIYCCDNIRSSCCIRSHRHHRHHTNHNQSPSQHQTEVS